MVYSRPMDTVFFFQAQQYGIAAKRREFDGLLQFAREADWHVQEIPFGTDGRKIRAMIGFWHPIGAVIANSEGEIAVRPSTLGRLPAVYLCRSPKEGRHYSFAVSYDSSGIMALAAREMSSASLKACAFIHYPKMPLWSVKRASALERMLSSVDMSLNVFTAKSDSSFSPGYMKRLAKWLAAIPKPVGVFAANDQVGAAVLGTCQKHGMSVPGDVAVIGVDDDTTICENTTPTMTSIARDYERGGYESGRLLAEVIDGGLSGPVFRTVPTARVVRRASTMRMMRTDRAVIAAMERIRLEACNGLKARDVAAMFGCSRRMGEMRFRRAMGKSILDAIHEIRLEKAKTLLVSGGMDLGAISNLCGYATATSFANFFAAQTGLSPSAWRKSGADECLAAGGRGGRGRPKIVLA